MADETGTAPATHATSPTGSIVSALKWLGPIGAARGDDGRFTRTQVWSKVAVIFLYIVIGTVWFPSYLMEPLSLAVIRDLYAFTPAAWEVVQSVIVSTVWLLVLAAAFVGMRKAQKYRLI